MKDLIIEVNEENAGERIDKFLSVLVVDSSRTSIQKSIENGNIFVNGNKVNKKYKVQFGDEVKIFEQELKLLTPSRKIFRLTLFLKMNTLLS